MRQPYWWLPSVRGVPLTSVPRLFARPFDANLDRPLHVFICVADHYEPYWGAASRVLAHQRVDRWADNYPRSVEGLQDSWGRSPQHSFFYPAEEYDAVILDKLADLCRSGAGDVEIHLHHENDTSDGFREKIQTFAEQLYYQHGLLRRDSDGRISYAFIHGNWALDNARPDGFCCGVNDEITILEETGCYADMTLPCAPEAGQTRMVNSIYYAVDDPQRPKSHDWGTPARVGSSRPPNSLLMIQGPLAWNLRSRKWGLLPRLETGDLHRRNGPSLERLRLWIAAGVRVAGRPDWTFVKLHTHGAMEENSALFLDGSVRQFHLELAEFADQHPEFHYYYVTPREMASLIHQAEQGAVQPVLPAAKEQFGVSRS